MKIFDSFVQQAQNQGVATVEQPTNGAKPSDVQGILTAMSGLFGEASAAVNAFQGTVQGGKATQEPVVQEVKTLAPRDPDADQPRGKLGIVLVVLGVLAAVFILPRLVKS